MEMSPNNVGINNKRTRFRNGKLAAPLSMRYKKLK